MTTNIIIYTKDTMWKRSFIPFIDANLDKRTFASIEGSCNRNIIGVDGEALINALSTSRAKGSRKDGPLSELEFRFNWEIYQDV
jgi:hypothetical protein